MRQERLKPFLSGIGIVEVDDLMPFFRIAGLARYHKVLNCALAAERNRLDVIDGGLPLLYALPAVEAGTSMGLVRRRERIDSAPRTTRHCCHEVKRSTSVITGKDKRSVCQTQMRRRRRHDLRMQTC